MLYGIKAGIFARHGLDLQITKLNGGSATAALLAGSFDLGKGNISSWLEARAKNLPIALIAAASVHNANAPMPRSCSVHIKPDWLKARLGVPVVEGIGAPIRFAAMLASLGLRHSRKRWPKSLSFT